MVNAAGAKLTGTTIQRWMGTIKAKPDQAGTEALVSAWIDVALLATSMSAGTRLDDSATVDAVIEPDADRGAINKFAAARAAAMPDPTDAQIDSIGKLGMVRVFQQIMLVIPRTADSATIGRVTLRAKQLHQQAVDKPATFTALVREASEDTASRARDGYLPAGEYNDFAPQLAQRLWTVRPGEISLVTLSESGRHIFRRATLEESRPAVKTWLRNRRARAADSVFRDSLTNARNINVAPDAASRLRASLREPVLAPAGPPLATWKGGALTPASARVWMMMLNAIGRMSLYASSDSSVRAYVRELAWREILLADVAPTGGITPEARHVLGAEYRTALDSVRAPLLRVGTGLSPEQLATAAADSALAGRIRIHPLPGALSAVLRTRYPVTVDTAALNALVHAAIDAWQPPMSGDSTAKTSGKP